MKNKQRDTETRRKRRRQRGGRGEREGEIGREKKRKKGKGEKEERGESERETKREGERMRELEGIRMVERKNLNDEESERKREKCAISYHCNHRLGKQSHCYFFAEMKCLVNGKITPICQERREIKRYIEHLKLVLFSLFVVLLIYLMNTTV